MASCGLTTPGLLALVVLLCVTAPAAAAVQGVEPAVAGGGVAIFEAPPAEAVERGKGES